MMKWIAVAIVAALVVSALSMFVPTGQDDSEVETIGVQTRFGFPVPYRIMAPGLAWADFNAVAFGLNTALWLVVSVAVIFGIRRRRRKQRRSNGDMEAVANAGPQG